jgi:hypothetical protein
MAAIVAVAGWTARLRPFRGGGMVLGAGMAGAAIIIVLGGRSDRGLRRRRLGARRLLGGLAGFLFGALARLLLGSAIVFGAALFILGGLERLPVLAAASLLERGQAAFLGLAKQPFLKLLAGGGVADGTGGASTLGASTGSPGRPRMRLFLTSTTTVFERPWLKLCFTLPVSMVRLMPSGARAPRVGLSVVSLITILRPHP